MMSQLSAAAGVGWEGAAAAFSAAALSFSRVKSFLRGLARFSGGAYGL